MCFAFSSKVSETTGRHSDKFRSEFWPHRSTLGPWVVDHRNLHLKLPRLHGLQQNTHSLQTVCGVGWSRLFACLHLGRWKLLLWHLLGNLGTFGKESRSCSLGLGLSLVALGHVVTNPLPKLGVSDNGTLVDPVVGILWCLGFRLPCGPGGFFLAFNAYTLFASMLFRPFLCFLGKMHIPWELGSSTLTVHNLLYRGFWALVVCSVVLALDHVCMVTFSFQSAWD